MRFDSVTLYKPKNGKTYCFKIPSWMKPDKRHYNTRESVKKDAEKVRDDFLTQLQSSANDQVYEEAYLDKAIDSYLVSKAYFAKRSFSQYRTTILDFKKFIVEKLGKIPRLQEIKKPMIEEFLAAMKCKVGHRRGLRVNPHTRNDRRNYLTNFFINAVDNGWLEKNPVKKISKIPEPESVHPEPLNTTEVKKLLDDLKRIKRETKYQHKCYYEITAIAYYAGARISEVLHLFKSDIEFNNKRIFLHNKPIGVVSYYTKTKRGWHTPIVPELEEILRKWTRKVRDNPSQLLFPNSNGNPIKYDLCYNVVVASMARVGLPAEKPFHRGRHTFASIASKNDVKEQFVQGALGHKSNIMTRHYTHVSPEEIANKFSQLSYGQNKEGKA